MTLGNSGQIFAGQKNSAKTYMTVRYKIATCAPNNNQRAKKRKQGGGTKFPRLVFLHPKYVTEHTFSLFA